MPPDPDPHADPHVAPPELTLRPATGQLVYDGIAIGQVRGDTLVVNLGWMKAAGMHLRVEDDPAVDHHRGGVTLER